MAKLLGFVAVLLVGAALATGCGRTESGVHVRWETPREDAPVVSEDGSFKADPVQTMVYISNGTNEPLHGAELRLKEATRNSLTGVSIGTITSASTHFDGATRVWSVGDIEPGTRVGFQIGLWFSGRYPSTGTDSLELTVELASPDLGTPVASNQLTFSVSGSHQ